MRGREGAEAGGEKPSGLTPVKGDREGGAVNRRAAQLGGSSARPREWSSVSRDPAMASLLCCHWLQATWGGRGLGVNT